MSGRSIAERLRRQQQGASKKRFALSRRFLIAYFVAAACSGSAFSQESGTSAGDASSREWEVKAGFLLNFTRFIDWPKTDGTDEKTPFTICTLGDDPFGQVLDQTVQDEQVNGRKLAVQRLGHATSAKGCEVVYVNSSEAGVRELLNSMGTGVLTVGEGEEFLRDGGMIAFVPDDRRVRFSINLGAARKAELVVSSRLLAVAKSVNR